MRSYKVTVGGQEYALRLTVSGQKRLKKKHPEMDPISIIMSAPADAEVMTDVLHEALNWPGNANPNQSGEQVYDLLVDDGVGGQEAFAEIACNIGVASGLMTEANSRQVIEGVRKVVETAYGSIGAELAPESGN